MGNLCSLRAFDPCFLSETAHTVVFIGISRFWRILLLVPGTPGHEMFTSRPYTVCRACYLAATQSLGKLVLGHTIEQSGFHWCCVVDIEISRFQCSNNFTYWQVCCPCGVAFWQTLFMAVFCDAGSLSDDYLLECCPPPRWWILFYIHRLPFSLLTAAAVTTMHRGFVVYSFLLLQRSSLVV